MCVPPNVTLYHHDAADALGVKRIAVVFSIIIIRKSVANIF